MQVLADDLSISSWWMRRAPQLNWSELTMNFGGWADAQQFHIQNNPRVQYIAGNMNFNFGQGDGAT